MNTTLQIPIYECDAIKRQNEFIIVIHDMACELRSRGVGNAFYIRWEPYEIENERAQAQSISQSTEQWSQHACIHYSVRLS